MVRVISCQAAAILLCVVAAYAVATPMIGKEKRNAVPNKLLPTYASFPKDGIAKVRSLAKEKRSVDQRTRVSASATNCGEHAVSHSVVEWGSDWDWNARPPPAMRSAARSAISNNSAYSLHFLALLQMILVFISMA
ncbi:hypothetical protein PoB_006534700 [Plakobranchus ocellatus]|uniref:Uncharacterized protein n=1 Tax=Plakobranchus ocellatus TaxID=259542 RepID=A0AAV4D3V4_9GAST|nr:hypothetical protein PoB_006534700 [Plakobranchus ocellatus]